MKTFLIIVVSFLFFPEGYGQEYRPFDFDHGIWRCYTYRRGDGYGEAYQLQYYAKGDTLINDTIYRKLNVFGYKDQLIPHVGYIYFNNYAGAIRNNVSQKTVRFIGPNVTISKIIYDFNLQPGDTISHFFDAPNLQVTAIDSVLICNKYHKVFKLNDMLNTGETLSLIEGIGFNAGLLSPWLYNGENDSWLICYTETNSLFCEPCELLLSRNNLKVAEDVSLTYFNNILTIKSSSPVIGLKIFDTNGKMIRNELSHHVPEYSLDISDINARGLLLIQIDSEAGRIVKLFTK